VTAPRPAAGTERPDRSAGAALEAEQALESTVAHTLRGLFGRDSLFMVIWVVQLLCAALLTPIITRVIGVGEFGGVAAATAVMQILFVVAGLGLSTAIQRQYVARGGPAQARTLLTVALVAAALVTVLVDATGPLWSPQLGFGSYGGAVRLAVIWAGVAAVTYSALALLRSKDRLLAFSCVSLLQSFVSVAVSLALIAIVHPTATVFILGQLLTQILALGLAFLWVPPARLRRSDAAMVRTALAYGLPLVPAVLGTFVLLGSDRFIVQAQMGTVEVARYQVASNIGFIPLMLVSFLNMAWLPRIFALEDSRERPAVLAASRDALYTLLIPVVIGLSVGAPLMLRIWAPAQYRPYHLLMVTALVIISVLPYTAAAASTRTLLARGGTHWIALTTLAAAGANVGLNLVLVPRWGLSGAALSTFLAYFLLQRLLSSRVPDAVAARPASPGLLLGLVAAGLAAVLAAVLPTSAPFLVLRSLVVLATLVWFAWQLRSLTTGAFPRRRGAEKRPKAAAERSPQTSARAA
jgi:O-antigen/teichoic acid export membrane protein